jgi:hypothetical protein
LKAAELLKVIYLCRVNPSTIVLEKNNDQFQRIDFIELTKFMRSHEISSIEKEVYLGAEEKLKTRMIIFLMPEEEYAKRIRKAEQNNKKKGRGQVGKEFKARAALNLFITNASAELIPALNVWKFYRLRWQIELIFKVWKSICDISKVKKVKKHRLECYIYSKLILIVFGWKILWHTSRRLFCHERKALSFFKASKTLLKRKIEELREIVLLGKRNFDKFLENFYELSKTNHILEKRKHEPSSLELLLQCINF